MKPSHSVSRRRMLASATVGLVAVAGCTSLQGGGSGTQQRTFDITLSESDGTIAATIEPKGDVADVIKVTAGDDVTFALHNEREKPTGVHNHVTDERVVVDAGETHEMQFTPSDEQVGRYELEAFDADSGGEHHEESTDGDHEESTDSDHDETTDGDHEESGTGDHHDGESEVVIATVEVRPA